MSTPELSLTVRYTVRTTFAGVCVKKLQFSSFVDPEVGVIVGGVSSCHLVLPVQSNVAVLLWESVIVKRIDY